MKLIRVMQSGKQESILSNNQKAFVTLVIILIISFFIFFRNLFFQPTIILKGFGELSIDPEIALKNNKPTFLEFYAEWCEVCKEMAPKVQEIKNEYEKDINFVFLSVENSKWANYINKYSVNGIPQVNLINTKGELVTTLIGKQEEKNLKESLDKLKGNLNINSQISNSDFSSIKNKRKLQSSPRSHG